jgi:tripartite-type tricarboxylate transporter receptor subunit TctC
MTTTKTKALQLLWVMAVSGISATSTLASAQTYPMKPIKLIVGFTPGGAADFTGRATAEALSKILGQPVVVENKPGAGSSLAAEYVSRSAAPDGYTILLASPSSISVNPAMNPRMTHTVNTLVPISQVSSAPIVLAVNPKLGINSLTDLIAAAKKSPGKLNFASSGNGSAPHLGGVYFARAVDIDIQHIPYPGGSQASQSVIAGQVQLTFGTPPSVLPFVKADRLKGLAVSTPKRSPFAPDIPGMAELGYPQFNFSFWYGLFAPAGTPPEIIKKLHAATQIAMNADGPKAALAREATEVALSKSPEEFAAFLKEDAKLWTRLVKDSGAKAN